MSEHLYLIEQFFAGNVALSCLALSVFVYLSVIIIGFIVNSIEHGIMSLLWPVLGGRLSYFIMVYLTFPGTIFHELSHALACVISGAKVKEIVIFERPSTGRLGHVSFVARGGFIARAFQFSIISCAPVVLGLASLYPLYLFFNVFQDASIRILIVYIAYSIISHMSMSPQDIKNYLRGFYAVIPFIFICLYCVCIYV